MKPENKIVKINITGDFFISPEIEEPSELIRNLIPTFKNADLNIVNLESPVTRRNNKDRILKTGPHLNGHSDTFNILKKLNVKLVTLANNHIMDYGKIGLESTLKKLETNEIKIVGAGINKKKAAEPFYFIKGGLKIAILNFAENEWSIAGDNEPGANPLDVIDNVNQIRSLRKECDKIIVIIHGGHEYYHLPSPRMVKQYHFYAENGADAIIGHHTHCVGGYEVFKNVPIFYSLGNFLFTLSSKYPGWYNGLLLTLEITPNKIDFKLNPIKQNINDFKIEILKSHDKEKVLGEIQKYNAIILNEEMNQQYWRDFIDSNFDQSLSFFSPINLIGNRYIRAGLKRLKLNKILLQKQNLKEILNFIRCEAHSDVSKDTITSFLKK